MSLIFAEKLNQKNLRYLKEIKISAQFCAFCEHKNYQIMVQTTSINHWAIFINNTTNHQSFIQQLLQGKAAEPFTDFNTQKGLLFSTIILNAFIEEEDRHEHTDVLKNTTRKLKSMSSGERKKALLAYLL
jgi:hypothetical protein